MDSDDDGYLDGYELNMGMDPLDSSDYPGAPIDDKDDDDKDDGDENLSLIYGLGGALGGVILGVLFSRPKKPSLLVDTEIKNATSSDNEIDF